MAENNKDFTDHLSDFGKGLTSFFTTAYNFGDFFGENLWIARLAARQCCAKRLLSTRSH